MFGVIDVFGVFGDCALRVCLISVFDALCLMCLMYLMCFTYFVSTENLTLFMGKIIPKIKRSIL